MHRVESLKKNHYQSASALTGALSYEGVGNLSWVVSTGPRNPKSFQMINLALRFRL